MEQSFIFTSSLPDPTNADLSRTFEVIYQVSFSRDGAKAEDVKLICTSTECEFPFTRLGRADQDYLTYSLQRRLENLPEGDADEIF